MPNGYKDAPRLFTKLLKVPLSRIRDELGVTLAAYLDDSLGMERGRKQDFKDLPYKLIEIFQEFGYTINMDKSCLDLTQEIEFLGFILNSVKMTITLSEKKTDSIVNAIEEILQTRDPTIRQVCRVIGKIIATMPANRFAKRFTNRAILLKDQALKMNHNDYDCIMALSEEVIKDFLQQKQEIAEAICPIFESYPDFELFSDASLRGWGIHAPFRRDKLSKFGGRWDDCHSQKHINTLRL